MSLFYDFSAIDHFGIHFVGTEEIPFAVILPVVLVGAFKVHSVLRNRHDTFCTHAILEGALKLAAIGVKQGGIGGFEAAAVHFTTVFLTALFVARSKSSDAFARGQILVSEFSGPFIYDRAIVSHHGIILDSFWPISFVLLIKHSPSYHHYGDNSHQEIPLQGRWLG